MASSIRPILATLLLASAGCSGVGSTAPDLAGNGRPSNVISQTAPTPSASCTWTANGDGKYTGVMTWSGITTWSVTFWDNSNATGVAVTHPTHRGSASYSRLDFTPTGGYLNGRKGQILLTVTGCSG